MTHPPQATRAPFSPVLKRRQNLRTHQQPNTLDPQSTLHRVRTRSRTQALRHPHQPAKVRVRGEMKAELRNRAETPKKRHNIRPRAKTILAPVTSSKASRIGAVRTRTMPREETSMVPVLTAMILPHSRSSHRLPRIVSPGKKS